MKQGRQFYIRSNNYKAHDYLNTYQLNSTNMEIFLLLFAWATEDDKFKLNMRSLATLCICSLEEAKYKAYYCRTHNPCASF